jgi:hypothetical protein
MFFTKGIIPAPQATPGNCFTKKPLLGWVLIFLKELYGALQKR